MGEITISTIETVKHDETKATKSGSTKFPQFVAGLTVGIASFMYGSVIGWLSPVLPLLQSVEPAVGDVPITNDEVSWLGSLMFLGALVASPIFSYISQHFGRKAAGYMTTLPLIICWILTLSGNSVLELYIARFLSGVSSGGVVVFFPMYCSEIAEDSIRGALGTFLPLFCNAGTLFVYVIGPFVSFNLLAIISLALPLLFLVCFYRQPESPTYLLSKGRLQEAENSLMHLRGGNAEVVEEDMRKLRDLVNNHRTSESSDGSQKNMLLTRGGVRAIMISVVICFAQQCSGVFVVLNYCVEILEMSGSALSPSIASMFVVALQVIGSLLSSFFIEFFGRKTLLIGSKGTMAICLGILGTYFHFQLGGMDMDAITFIPAVCLSLFLFFNAAGLGPVTYVLISEIFHPDVRGIAMTIATCTSWSLAFLVTKLYPLLAESLGLHGCFWGFSGVCVVCMVYAIFQVPETKNRSVDSILRDLNGERHETLSCINSSA